MLVAIRSGTNAGQGMQSNQLEEKKCIDTS